MKKRFNKKLLQWGLISLLFVGCGDSTEEILNMSRIWTEKSNKIEILQYSGDISPNSTSVDEYIYLRENLSKKALDKLKITYAWENLKGMKCQEDGTTYKVVVYDKNNSSKDFYSANTYCNNTEGKKFIPVVSIEKLIDILE